MQQIVPRSLTLSTSVGAGFDPDGAVRFGVEEAVMAIAEVLSDRDPGVQRDPVQVPLLQAAAARKQRHLWATRWARTFAPAGDVACEGVEPMTAIQTNRVQRALRSCPCPHSQKLPQATRDSLEATAAIDSQEHFAYQEQQARAHADERLSLDEATLVYTALGESGSQQNGDWADATDLATKLTVTRLIGGAHDRELSVNVMTGNQVALFTLIALILVGLVVIVMTVKPEK